MNSELPLPDRVPTPWRVRLGDLARGPGQLCMWLMLGGVGLWMASTGTPQSSIVGVVRGGESTLSFARSGRIAELFVREGTEVTAGAPVARLSDALHEARVAVARVELASVIADVESLSARQRALTAERALTRFAGTNELVADAAANRSRVRDEVWRLEIEERQRRLDIQALEVEIETDLLSAEQVRVQAERFASLTGEGFARRADVQDRELAEQTLLGRVEANRRLLETLRDEAAFAAQSLDRAKAALSALGDPAARDAATEALEQATVEADLAAIEALRSRVEARRATVTALRTEQDDLLLIASIDGRVARVDAHIGQSVVAGAPVVMLESAAPRDVAVYLPEPVRGDEAVPRTVQLARRSAPEQSVEAQVLGFGRGVEALPERLWTRPGFAEYGRTLLVEPPESMRLVPGEVLTVSLPQSE